MRLDFTQNPSLHQDADGTIRVIGSRITLDTLIAAFQRGDTPDQIHDGFPTLTLPQIYGAIAWYLNNQSEADEYLKTSEAEANELRETIECQPENIALRQTLRQKREQLIEC